MEPEYAQNTIVDNLDLGMSISKNTKPEVGIEDQKIIIEVITNTKALSIVKALYQNQKLHFNKIHDLVGGSKSTLSKILRSLEGRVLENNWETIHIKDSKGKDKPIYAKMYEIKDSTASSIIIKNILPFIGR